MNDRSGLRLVILGVLVFSLPITLLGRLWYMQALAGAQYVAAVNANAPVWSARLRRAALSSTTSAIRWPATTVRLSCRR